MTVLKFYFLELILYSGYSMDEATWEPLENMKGCSMIL